MTSNIHAAEPDPAVTARWESGALGQSEEHAAVADSKLCAALDEGQELQLVSIRLQRDLIQALKFIAKHHGLAYQPLIRDLLNRFVASEMKHITHELDKRLEAARADQESVVEDFIAREHSARKTA